jgi:hypothetical protein
MTTTKTYAEANGAAPFDWNAFLSIGHTEEEWEAANVLSQEWVTCACGNQCDALPRNRHGEPLDPELFWAGNEFNSAIHERDMAEAQRILAKIEKRTGHLLAMLNSAPQPA